MHYNIDQLQNNLPSNTDSKEMQYFQDFQREHIKGPGIVPYRTEWAIADPSRSIAGSVDFVGKLPNNKYVIMDWKRSKGLIDNLTNRYNKFALYVTSMFSHIGEWILSSSFPLW